jgi:hypothetical protein
MAANLMSVVMQFLTPDMMAKIASCLGIDRSIAQKAIGGAIPALLSGLADVASTPHGARQFSNVLSQQPPGSLESLKSIIGGSSSSPSTLADTGSNLLSGLFGGGAMETMSQSIGKFAGIGEGSGKSLLGMLGPVVFGALSQYQRNAGLDAGGLASLLGSQKDQLMAAIPSGLADQLSAAGLIDRAQGVRSAATAASTAEDRVFSSVDRTTTGSRMTSRAAPSQWPYWILGLAVLGGLAWYGLGRPKDNAVAELPRPAANQQSTTTVGLAPADLSVGGKNLATEVNASVGTLRSVLPGITDSASAQAALPKIQEAAAQLNEVSALSSKLTPEGKSALAKLITASMPTINQMCDKVLATSGGSIAKPVIDELRGRLDTLSRA